METRKQHPPLDRQISKLNFNCNLTQEFQPFSETFISLYINLNDSYLVTRLSYLFVIETNVCFALSFV